MTKIANNDLTLNVDIFVQLQTSIEQHGADHQENQENLNTGSKSYFKSC